MSDSVLSDPHALPDADPSDGARLALFGHDLRAALSDVVDGLRLIDPTGFDTLTRAQVDRVRVSAEGLARLLDRGLGELLGEGLALQVEYLDLQRFLTDIDLRWSGSGLASGTGFVLQRAADLPASLSVDRVTLDRVVSNLIGNAFKYAARGRVSVDVMMRADGGLRLVVRDDGPGFPLRVLDGPPVLRGHPGRSGTGPQSGLGLPIVADLLLRIGGQLTLHNRAVGGAEAVVDLPPGLSEPEVLHEDTASAQLKGRRVLVADDNPTSQSIAAGLLRALGAEVVSVSDGVDARERLEAEVFDLLLVDVQMPRLSGLDVIRALRKLPGAAGRVPVIAVTAYGLPSDRRALLAVGADDVLTKPLLCPQAVAGAIRKAMARSVPIDPPATVHLCPAAVFEADRLQRLLDMAGPETGRDLLDRLVSDLGVVHHGLTTAADEPDWQAIRGHSHVLISLAGAVGGFKLSSGAEALNLLAQRTDGTALDALLPGVLVELEALIAGIEQARRAHAASG